MTAINILLEALNNAEEKSERDIILEFENTVENVSKIDHSKSEFFSACNLNLSTEEFRIILIDCLEKFKTIDSLSHHLELLEKTFTKREILYMLIIALRSEGKRLL